MAVWKQVIAGVEVKIHNVDHWPPHELPPGLRRGLAAIQDDLLTAWERVHVTPPRGETGD